MNHDRIPDLFPKLNEWATSELWGEVEPVEWVQLRLFTEHDPQAWVVGQLVATTLPHHRFIEGREVTIGKAHHCVSSWRLHNRDIHRLSGFAETAKYLGQAMVSAGRDLAPFLYAYDPRIGRLWGMDDVGIGRSPLFDPPKMEYPLYHRGVACTLRCPLCGKGFSEFKPAMWAGGSILWTHQECWLRFAGGRSVDLPRSGHHAPLDFPGFGSSHLVEHRWGSVRPARAR